MKYRRAYVIPPAWPSASAFKVFGLNFLIEVFSCLSIRWAIRRQQSLPAHLIDKLEKTLGGIKHLNRLPDAIVVIDVGYEDIAVKEARKNRKLYFQHYSAIKQFVEFQRKLNQDPQDNDYIIF